MNDEKCLLSDLLKRFEKHDRSSLRKLIKFCQKNGCEVFIKKDEDNEDNPGEYDPGTKEIRLNPKLLEDVDELVIYFLHEIGHLDQFVNHEDTMKEKFPGVMLITRNDLKEKKWKTKTQKYWIDYVGVEQDAWSRGYDIAKKLNVDFDLDRWTKIRLCCLRSAGVWLAGTFTS